ncbi:MAG: hypothetical protein HQ521_11730 [Bacteroidetes bacterium]|nr:hypothetical protein [Bacteroidota bacterium]
MMKKFRNILTTIIVLQLAPLIIHAGGNVYPIGSRSAGMGRSSVAITDFWSAINNQAGIALFKKPSVGIYYENRFLVNELSTKSIAGIIPTKFGVFAATYNNFGYNLYNEQKIGLAYARSMGKYFRIGLQLDYLMVVQGNNYGNKNNVTFELGIQSDISESITLGAWVYNPIRVQIADYDDEKIPAIFRFGFTWHISDVFLATLESEKGTAINPIIIRGGLEYNIQSMYYFRTGFSTRKEIFSFGIGLYIKHLTFDISAIMHETLGFSPQASLIYKF